MSDANPLAWDLEQQDPDPLTPGVLDLGLLKDYAPNFTPKDAFREFYQNWKDALVSTYELDPRAFKPVVKDNAEEVLITVHREVQMTNIHTTKELIGFIRLSKTSGKVQIANFKARLNRRNLCLGRTTRRTSEALVGTHGEGLKLAALAMCRQGYGMQIHASSFHWVFKFRGYYENIFCCQLNQPKKKDLDQRKAEFMKKLMREPTREPIANIWEDVCIEIRGKAVREQEFKSWIKIALDIKGPAEHEVVQTRHGSLLLSKRFAGSLYLKGIRLAPSSWSPRYSLGYNLLHGEMGYNREGLANPDKQAAAITQIWEASMLERGNVMISRYLRLFLDVECPDIHRVEQLISKETVEFIWSRMKLALPHAFYYPEQEMEDEASNENAIIIREHLGKAPVEIPRKLWSLLRKFGLPRTPREERACLVQGFPARKRSITPTHNRTPERLEVQTHIGRHQNGHKRIKIEGSEEAAA